MHPSPAKAGLRQGLAGVTASVAPTAVAIGAAKIGPLRVSFVGPRPLKGSKYISEFRFRISEIHNIDSQQVVKNQNGDYFR